MFSSGLKLNKWYQSGLALNWVVLPRVYLWPPLSWIEDTHKWSLPTLIGITMLTGKCGWKPSWNLWMRKLGCLWKLVRKNLPHMWLNGLMPKKKQLALIARQWMQYSMLFLLEKYMFVSHTKHTQQKINKSTLLRIDNMYYVNFRI